MNVRDHAHKAIRDAGQEAQDLLAVIRDERDRLVAMQNRGVFRRNIPWAPIWLLTMAFPMLLTGYDGWTALRLALAAYICGFAVLGALLAAATAILVFRIEVVIRGLERLIALADAVKDGER